MDDVLKVAEVAVWLRVHPRTIYRAVERGDLPHVEGIGSAVRIPAEAVEALVHPAKSKKES